MTNLSGRELHEKAKSALADAKFPPKKFVLIFSLILLVPSLIFNCLIYWFGDISEILTGVSGTNYPAVASLVATLSFLFSIFSIFFNASFTVFSLRVSRREAYSTDTLWAGFRLWKRVLGSTFMIFARFLCLYLVGVFAMLMLAIVPGLGPFLMVAALIALLIYMVRLAYSLWAVPFMALDDTSIPVSVLCALSSRLMVGRKWQVFKVQLHFFWYILLLAVIETLPSVYFLFTSGFTLPQTFSIRSLPPIFYFGSIVLQFAANFLFYLWKQDEISVTYATAYNTILSESMPESRQEPFPSFPDSSETNEP